METVKWEWKKKKQIWSTWVTDVSFRVMFPIPVPVTGVTVLSKIVRFFEGKKKKEIYLNFWLAFI